MEEGPQAAGRHDPEKVSPLSVPGVLLALDEPLRPLPHGLPLPGGKEDLTVPVLVPSRGVDRRCSPQGMWVLFVCWNVGAVFASVMYLRQMVPYMLRTRGSKPAIAGAMLCLLCLLYVTWPVYLLRHVR